MIRRYAPPITGQYNVTDTPPPIRPPTYEYKPSIFERIAGIFKPQQLDESEPLDVDKDGEELYKDDIIAFVLEQIEKRKRERFPLEQQWVLNSNFLAGNQYCEINPYQNNMIMQTESAIDGLERDVYNRIAPLIETRIANLQKISYSMVVKPRTNELDDYAKADTSTALLRHLQQVSDFDTLKNTVIVWNELCGNCFWLSWWDKDKGEIYSQSGEATYYEGDIDYGLLSPYEVYPESIFKQTVKEQRSIIVQQIKSVADIYDTYGIDIEGSEQESFALTPVTGSTGYARENTVCALGRTTISDAQIVTTYFERPSRQYQNGRLIILIGEEHLAYYGDLPYKRIPIVQTKCKEVAGQFFGKSVIEELIPLQRAYNGCVNRIHEFIKRISLQGYLVQEGSVDCDNMAEHWTAPGALIPYAQGSQVPVPIPQGKLPNEVMSERQNLIRDMEYTAGVSQLMVVGATPAGVTSGTAIESLREIDNTRLSLTGDYIRNSVKNNAILWLEIYKKYATTRRVIQTVGTNDIANALVWSNEDINSFDVSFDTENELLHSEEAQKQRFFEALQMGLFTDEMGRIPQWVKAQALEYTKKGAYSELMDLNRLQMQAAQRENVFFEKGILPKVGEFDDHVIHIEEHKKYILQLRFSILKMKKEQYAQGLIEHVKEHMARVVAGQERMMGIGRENELQ